MMESRDQRIMTLATTLKSSGIAKTDSQARMMAEDMIGVEEHVQKSYEEEHVKAHEYLQTAKNLRVPRPASASELAAMQSSSEQKSTSRIIEPLASNSSSTQSLRAAVTDPNFGEVDNSGSLNFSTSNRHAPSTGHDTHNSAIEAIKSMVQNERIVPLEDQAQPTLSEQVNSTVKEDVAVDVSVKENNTVPKEIVIEDKNDIVSVDESVDSTAAPSEVVKDSKLDAKKLVELMEEDGKLEEHTREIKEPPKDVKPKEDYAENSIDLSSVFSFNKK